MGFVDRSGAQKCIRAAREAFNLGEDQAAIENYEKALELVPDEYEVLRNLALLYGRNLVKLDRVLPLGHRSLGTFEGRPIGSRNLGFGESMRLESQTRASLLVIADAIYNALANAPNLVPQLWSGGREDCDHAWGDILPSLLPTRRIRYADLVSYMWSDVGQAYRRFPQEELKLPKPAKIPASVKDILLKPSRLCVYLDIESSVRIDEEEAIGLAYLQENKLPYVDVAPWDVAWWIAYDMLRVPLFDTVSDPILVRTALTLRSGLDELMGKHNETGRKEDGDLHHLTRVPSPKLQSQVYHVPVDREWVEVAEPPCAEKEG